MKGGEKPHGYTIVEVMIVLAVSGALMVSTILMIRGKHNATEFIQASRELESALLDVINDVSVGYYPTTGQIKCDAAPPLGSGITLSNASTAQGTNAGCTFIGRVVQFAPHGTDARNLRIYTVAGQRLTSANREVISIEEAKGKTIAKANAGDTTPDAFEDFDLGPITIGKVIFDNGAVVETGGVGFFTTFNSYTSDSLDSGSTSAILAPLPPIPGPGAFTLDQPPFDFVTNLNNLLPDPNFKNTFNPTNGVTICVLSRGTDQHAELKIGGDSRQLTTQLLILDGNDLVDCP